MKQVGRIVVLTDRAVFKIGIVLGESKIAGKVRIRPWSDAPRRWTAIQTIEWTKCQDVSENLGHVPSGEATRRRNVVRRAIERAPAAVSGLRGWA